MTHGELVEKVARGLCHQHYYHPFRSERELKRIINWHWTEFESQAKAAIEIVRDASEDDATVESRIITSRIADKVLASEEDEPFILDQCQLLERAARNAALDEAAKLVCSRCERGWSFYV